jgi:hypothetical protein
MFLISLFACIRYVKLYLDDHLKIVLFRWEEEMH